MDPYLCDLNKEAPAVRFKKPIPTGSEKLTLEYITYYAGHSLMTAIDPFTDLASQDVTLQIQVGSNHMTISSEEFQKFQEFTEERQPAVKILSARYHGGGLMVCDITFVYRIGVPPLNCCHQCFVVFFW